MTADETTTSDPPTDEAPPEGETPRPEYRRFVTLVDRTDALIFVRAEHIASVTHRSGGGTKITLLGGGIAEVQQSPRDVMQLVQATLAQG